MQKVGRDIKLPGYIVKLDLATQRLNHELKQIPISPNRQHSGDMTWPKLKNKLILSIMEDCSN